MLVKSSHEAEYKAILPHFEHVFSQTTDADCYQLTRQQVMLLRSIIDMYTWSTRWYVENQYRLTREQHKLALDLVANLHARLIDPLECASGEPAPPPPAQPPAQPPSWQDWLSSDDIEEILEEYGMACKCPEFKVENGIVYMRLNDCGCSEWIALSNTSDTTVTGNVDIEGEKASVGAALLDMANQAARANARIPIASSTLPNSGYVNLTKCAKATAIVDLWYKSFELMVEVDSLVVDVVDWLPVETAPIIAAIGQFLPPPYDIVFASASFIFVAADMATDDMNDIQNFVTTIAESQREEIICSLSAQMSSDNAITGSDLMASVNELLAYMTFGASVLIKITTTWNISGIAKFMNEYQSQSDCGCGDITNPPQELGSVTGAAWCKVWDFTASNGNFTESNGPAGLWTSGQGWEAEYATSPNGGRVSVWLVSPAFDTRKILAIDYYFTGLTSGQHNGDAPDEQFVIQTRISNTIIGFTALGNGWVRQTLYNDISQFNLLAMIGYLEGLSQATNPGGAGTLQKVRIHGLGTVPTQLASLPNCT